MPRKGKDNNLFQIDTPNPKQQKHEKKNFGSQGTKKVNILWATSLQGI
jgi:hypothetical protein